MDGQSRTCIEWMCNDEYEPGSFDLNNIMSPPDHESMMFSLMHANPLAEESPADAAGSTGQAGLAQAAAQMTAAPQPPPAGQPSSLLSLVQKLNLMGIGRGSAPAEDAGAATAAPSLKEAVEEALPSLTEPITVPSSGGAGSTGLSRVTSESQLSALDTPPGRRERRPSISCPNTPPAQRRRHPFFTESVFDPERPAAISRAWEQQQQQQMLQQQQQQLQQQPQLQEQPQAAAAGDEAGAVPAPAPKRSGRVRPRASRLRELNFLAPTSM